MLRPRVAQLAILQSGHNAGTVHMIKATGIHPPAGRVALVKKPGCIGIVPAGLTGLANNYSHLPFTTIRHHVDIAGSAVQEAIEIKARFR